MWGLTVEVEGGLGRGGQRGKNWDNCNRITIKYFLKSYSKCKNEAKCSLVLLISTEKLFNRQPKIMSKRI